VHATEFDSALSDEELMELGETLLRFMTLELCPELEMLVEHLQSFLVVLWQLNLLPELVREMGSFDSLHVQITRPFLLEHCRVPSVSKRA